MYSVSRVGMIHLYVKAMRQRAGEGEVQRGRGVESRDDSHSDPGFARDNPKSEGDFQSVFAEALRRNHPA
ncbi:MAG: hypothetical protein HQL57_11305 [Magnetococcales bacterium]|nr:hypothetical protein [Magnetococcales bacterium]MBF0157760.1 hypothetical protein [Magnetococcales bacterium]